MIHVLPNIVQISIFWTVQASALLAFAVPFRWAFVALWAASHFIRAIGLTLAFHRYFAHRAFKMNRVARFVWAWIATSAVRTGQPYRTDVDGAGPCRVKASTDQTSEMGAASTETIARSPATAGHSHRRRAGS